jgi:hypothetical protein
VKKFEELVVEIGRIKRGLTIGVDEIVTTRAKKI